MRIVRIVSIVAAVLIGGIALLSFFAGRAANMNCDEIAAEAKRISEGQPIQIRNISDIKETSRSLGKEGEGRCTGQAQFSDNSTGTLYMRAYEDGDNLMVEYSPTAFQ